MEGKIKLDLDRIEKEGPEKGFPWADTSREDHLTKGPRPRITMDHLGIHKENYDTAVYEMNNNKAPGPTRVPNEVLKYMPAGFHDELHALMQEMWANRHVPTNWKAGIFCFHHKKNDPTEQKNYRPIALLEGVFKLYTSLIADMIGDFCETQGILAQAQEGSRKQRNTLRQLTRVTNAIEDGCQPVGTGTPWNVHRLRKCVRLGGPREAT